MPKISGTKEMTGGVAQSLGKGTRSILHPVVPPPWYTVLFPGYQRSPGFKGKTASSLFPVGGMKVPVLQKYPDLLSDPLPGRPFSQ